MAGALANKPSNGGEAWVRLSWILGLRRLGFEVYFVEQISRGVCRDAQGSPADFGESVNRAYFRSVVDSFGLARRASLIELETGRTEGLHQAELRDVAEAAVCLINISGHLTLEPLLAASRTKVYVDIDPGFTQFWHALGLREVHLQGHDHYFTIGENIGTPGCPIPTGEIPWRPTRQPVVLDEWPPAKPRDGDRFTTVATWRSPYGPVEYEGRRYRLKHHEFRRFLQLAQLARGTFEIALEIDPADGADLEQLVAHGWHIVHPRDVASDPASFRGYIQGSDGEFSVAQGIYVETNSGWFSDRSARYLASGKPVLVQDTGFSRNLPLGSGLLTFRTLQEAIAGAEAILREYDEHARAARLVAEEYFDSDKVLAKLLEEVGVTW